jgi:transposase
MAEDIPNMIGSPVKDFVDSFLEGLEKGLGKKGYVTCPENQAHAKMKLHAIATLETSGKGGAKILGVGGELQTSNSDTSLQEMTVFIKKHTDADKEEEKVRLEVAKHQQKYIHPLALKDVR